jgi:hypothetical protein
MKLPTLWPKLNEVTVKVLEWNLDRSPEDHFGGFGSTFDSTFESRLMFLIGPTLRPTHLHIDLPNPNPSRYHAADIKNRPASVLGEMFADHVTVTNLSKSEQDIPRAKKSLEISFAARPGGQRYNFAGISSGVLDERGNILWNRALGVPNLTVVGFERGLGDIPVEDIEAELEKALEWLAMYREGDFRYRIKPWNSSEPGDWDVWPSIDEEFGQQ